MYGRKFQFWPYVSKAKKISQTRHGSGVHWFKKFTPMIENLTNENNKLKLKYFDENHLKTLMRHVKTNLRKKADGDVYAKFRNIFLLLFLNELSFWYNCF